MCDRYSMSIIGDLDYTSIVCDMYSKSIRNNLDYVY